MLARLATRDLIAAGTTACTFIPVSGRLDYIPGQFFTLTLTDPPYTDNRGNSRRLGIANLPDPSGVVTTVFRHGPSAFKRSLLEIPLGSQVDMSGVHGNLTLPDEPARPLVMITGGIGIVPLISMLRQVKAGSLPHKISLVYSNTDSARAVFLSELTDMAANNPDFSLTAVMTRDPDWKGNTARLSKESLSGMITDFSASRFFVTGTPRFVPDLVRALNFLGVTADRLGFEIFSGY